MVGRDLFRNAASWADFSTVATNLALAALNGGLLFFSVGLLSVFVCGLSSAETFYSDWCCLLISGALTCLATSGTEPIIVYPLLWRVPRSPPFRFCDGSDYCRPISRCRTGGRWNGSSSTSLLAGRVNCCTAHLRNHTGDDFDDASLHDYDLGRFDRHCPNRCRNSISSLGASFSRS